LKVLGYDRQFWYIFPAFLVLTVVAMLGLGWILGNRIAFIWSFFVAAVFIGLGIGFIVSRYTRVERAGPGSGVQDGENRRL